MNMKIKQAGIVFYSFLLFIPFLISAQIRTADIIHKEAWSDATKRAKLDNNYKYSIYSTRSLAVKHPELYLQADSIWMEAITTVYGGWQLEYGLRDRNDDNYWKDCGEKINNAFCSEIKYDGTQFQWSQMRWSDHRTNVVEAKNLYDTGAPYLEWFDLRLPLIWNGLKGEVWKTPNLTLAEALFFQERSQGKNVYLLISDNGKGYVARIENGVNTLYNPLTGLTISKSDIDRTIVLIMNTQNVWYPLFGRDDSNKDLNLGSMIELYSSNNAKPLLSVFENSLLNDLLAGTAYTSELDKNWMIMIAARFGKQWSWRAEPIRILSRKILPFPYEQPSRGDNSYELATINMVVTEMGNRLSPVAAQLAEVCYYNKDISPKVALAQTGNLYYNIFKRKSGKNTAYVYGEYFRIWLPNIEDKLLSGVGDCFVEGCNSGSALTIAKVPNWSVWVTNWWEKNSGGHVISGVYDSTGHGAVLSNGQIDQGYNGPMSTLNGKFIYVIIYNANKGFINFTPNMGDQSRYEIPFTNLDYVSSRQIIKEAQTAEPDIIFATTGNGSNIQIKNADQYSAYLETKIDQWKTFNLWQPISTGAVISGKIVATNGNPVKSVLVKLFSEDLTEIKSTGTDINGNYSMSGLSGGRYKVNFLTDFTVTEFVPKWYQNGIAVALAGENSVLSGINEMLKMGVPPVVAIDNPKKDSTITGKVSFIFNVQDDVAIKKVDVLLDTLKLITFTKPPFIYDFESSSFTNGNYNVKVKAYDSKDQLTEVSTPFKIFNDLPPIIVIQSPRSGETITTGFDLVVNASDDIGLKSVKYFIDGRLIGEKTTSPFNYPIDISTFSVGSHTIEAVAEDLTTQKSTSRILVNFYQQSYTSSFNPVYSWGMNPPGGKFNTLLDLAIGPDGNLYAVDSWNKRIQVFDQKGNFLRSFSTMGQPFGLCVSKSGFVYVAEGNIGKYSMDGVHIKSWGWDGKNAGEFKFATDVAVDSRGYVYVTDGNGNVGNEGDKSNDRIQKFDGEGNFIKMWGSTGSGPGQFSSPRGVCIDKNDIIYVVDVYNQRIQKFNTDGIYTGEWKLKDNVYTGSPRIWGIDCDDEGYIYLADTDNGRVCIFKNDGTLKDTWEQWWKQAGIPWTQGVAVSKNGFLYVSDDIGNRIIALTKSGEYQFQFGGPCSEVDGQMRMPNGIVIDNEGYVYVTDYYNQQVQKFTKEGTFVKRWGGLSYLETNGKFGLVFGITIDKKGFIYTTDFETRGAPGDHPLWARVQKFTREGEYISKWGELGTGDGKFFWPTGVTTDKNGKVYVVDAANNYVQVFTEEGRFLERWGKSGSLDGELSSPRSIVLDDEGYIYISDGYGSEPVKARIQKFTNKGIFVKNWYLPDSPRSIMPGMFGMVFDKFGFLYVADTHNQNGVDLIRQYSKEGQLINSFGRFSYDGCTGDPSGITISHDNLLYVTEINYSINKVSAFTLPYANAGLVDIKKEDKVPIEYSLSQNYPNPFNPETTINYTLPEESRVSISIYNLLGQKIVDLVNETKSMGTYNVKWNAGSLASGVYFYRIVALPIKGSKTFNKTSKMVLIK